MDMKISVDFDLSEFKEIWGDDSLSQCIMEEVKSEVLKKVKASDEYKAIVEGRMHAMMSKLNDI